MLTSLNELPFKISEEGAVSFDGKKVRVDVYPCKKLCRECAEGFAVDTAHGFECTEIEKCFPVQRDGVLLCSDPQSEFIGKII